MRKLSFKSVYQVYYMQVFSHCSTWGHWLNHFKSSPKSTLFKTPVILIHQFTQAQIQFLNYHWLWIPLLDFLHFLTEISCPFWIISLYWAHWLHMIHDEGIASVAEVLRNILCGRWLLPGCSGMACEKLRHSGIFTHLFGFYTLLLTALVKWTLLFSFLLWDDM